MEFISTGISDIKIIRPKVFSDDRGYFFESFNQREFDSNGGAVVFVQDNESLSKRGVLRGLHYQLAPISQTKLIRVVRGKIWDVAVDVRKSSPTFGKWVGQELSQENRLQLLVPSGFAHGFLVLSDEAVVQYKVDRFYSKEHDRGIIFNDPSLGIAWPDVGVLTISEKDTKQPLMNDAEVFP